MSSCFKVKAFVPDACFTTRALLYGRPYDDKDNTGFCFSTFTYDEEEIPPEDEEMFEDEMGELEKWGIQEIYAIHAIDDILYLIVPTYNPDHTPAWHENWAMVAFKLTSKNQIQGLVSVFYMNDSAYDDIFIWGKHHTKIIVNSNVGFDGRSFAIYANQTLFFIETSPFVSVANLVTGASIFTTNYCGDVIPTAYYKKHEATAVQCVDALRPWDCDESDIVCIAEVETPLGTTQYGVGVHHVTVADYTGDGLIIFRAALGSKSPIFYVDDVSIKDNGDVEQLDNGDFVDGLTSWAPSGVWISHESKALHPVDPTIVKNTISQYANVENGSLEFTLTVLDNTQTCTGKVATRKECYYVEGMNVNGDIVETDVFATTLVSDDVFFCTEENCALEEKYQTEVIPSFANTYTISGFSVNPLGIYEDAEVITQGYRKCYENETVSVQEYISRDGYSKDVNEGRLNLTYDGRYLCHLSETVTGIHCIEPATGTETEVETDPGVNGRVHDYTLANGIIIQNYFDGTINSVLKLYEIEESI